MNVIETLTFFRVEMPCWKRYLFDETFLTKRVWWNDKYFSQNIRNGWNVIQRVFFIFNKWYSWLSVVPAKFMQPAWRLLTKCGPWKRLAYLLYGSVASLPSPSSNIEAWPHGTSLRFAPAFRAQGVWEHIWPLNSIAQLVSSATKAILEIKKRMWPAELRPSRSSATALMTAAWKTGGCYRGSIDNTYCLTWKVVKNFIFIVMRKKFNKTNHEQVLQP